MTDATHINNKNNILMLYFAFLGILAPALVLFAPKGLTIYLLIMTITILVLGWGKASAYKPYLFLGGAFCFYIFISSFWSSDIKFTSSKSLKIIALSICAMTLFSFGNKLPRKYLKIFTTAFLITTILLSILIGFDYSFPVDKNITRYLFKPGSSLMAILTISLAFIYMEKRTYDCIIFTALTVIILLHFSFTMTSVIAIFCGFLAAIFMLIFKLKQSTLFAAPIILLIIFSPVLLTPNILVHMLDVGTNPSLPLLHRFAIWDFAISNIQNAPIFGHGVSASAIIEGGKNLIASNSLPTAFTSSENWQILAQRGIAELLPLHPHNIGLQLYLELGIIGIIFTSFIIWHLFKYAAQTNNKLLTMLLIILFIINQSSFSIWQSWWLSYQILIIFAAVQYGKQRNMIEKQPLSYENN